MKRKKINSKKSKKMFTRNSGQHKKNNSGSSYSMRGGIRL
jgi:hypothetical protein